MGPGVRPKGWRRWSALPLGGAVCQDRAQYPAFAPCISEVAVGFLYLVIQNLPQLRMYVVIFNLL